LFSFASERIIFKDMDEGTLIPLRLKTNTNRHDTGCSARDWELSGLLEENPQSGCTEICASLKGPL
jgi:hypothetical protein